MGFNPQTMNMEQYPDAARILERTLTRIEEGGKGIRLFYDERTEAYKMYWRLVRYKAGNKAQNSADPERYSYIAVSTPRAKDNADTFYVDLVYSMDFSKLPETEDL